MSGITICQALFSLSVGYLFILIIVSLVLQKLISLGFGATPMVFKAYSWWSYEEPGIEHGLTACKATLLPVVLSLGPEIPSPMSRPVLQEPLAASPAAGLSSGFLFLRGTADQALGTL